jgi:hypothetical protein
MALAIFRLPNSCSTRQAEVRWFGDWSATRLQTFADACRRSWTVPGNLRGAERMN